MYVTSLLSPVTSIESRASLFILLILLRPLLQSVSTPKPVVAFFCVNFQLNNLLDATSLKCCSSSK